MKKLLYTSIFVSILLCAAIHVYALSPAIQAVVSAGGAASCTTEVSGDSDTNGTGQTYVFGIATRTILGGTWTASDTYTSCKVTLRLKKVLSPTGNIKAVIYSTSAGVPDAQIAISSNSVATSAITTDWAEYDFTISANISNGTVYFIGAQTDAGSNATDNQVIAAFNESGTGAQYRYSDAGWTQTDSSARVYARIYK